jgi:hypothetical protein
MTIGNLLRAVVIGGAMLHGASAQAAIALTLEDPGPLLHGQGQGSPCVIGGSACGNPADFGYRLLPTGPAGADYQRDSPAYKVKNLRNQVGDVFAIGIDTNTTTSPLGTEVLNYFTAAVNGVVQFTYSGPTPLINAENGSGWADLLLMGFDLSGFDPNDRVVFSVSISGATAGPEAFFLIPVSVPEPASLAILATGLLGLGLVRRRQPA